MSVSYVCEVCKFFNVNKSHFYVILAKNEYRVQKLSTVALRGFQNIILFVYTQQHWLNQSAQSLGGAICLF